MRSSRQKQIWAWQRRLELPAPPSIHPPKPLERNPKCHPSSKVLLNIRQAMVPNQIFWLDSNHSSFFQYYFPSIYNLSLKSRVSFQILIFLQTGISTSEETLETMKYLNSPPFSPYLPNVILPHLSWIHSRLWSLASLGSFLISSFLQASRPPPLHLSLPTQYGIPQFLQKFKVFFEKQLGGQHSPITDSKTSIRIPLFVPTFVSSIFQLQIK